MLRALIVLALSSTLLVCGDAGAQERPRYGGELTFLVPVTWKTEIDFRNHHQTLAHSAEIDRRVQVALEDLSPLERAAFTLRHYEGRSIDEISAALGLGTSAAKHSVFRAVKKLRIALAPLRSQES